MAVISELEILGESKREWDGETIDKIELPFPVGELSAGLYNFAENVESGLVCENAVKEPIIDMQISGNSIQNNLPIGYQEVEYIKSTGTQYIDVGLKMTSDTKIEVKANRMIGTLLGVAEGTNVFALAGDGMYEYFRYYTTAGKQLSAKDDPRIYTIDQNKIYINGTLYYTENNYNYVDIDLNLFLLARNVDGEASSFRAGTIWYFKMYQGGVLVRDVKPCYRVKDNVAGLYDLVENKFYANSGTGVFTVGEDVVPTPDTPVEISSVGDKTPNLLTFYGRTENNFDGYSNPTNEKNISENEYTVGMARNGYVRPNQIAKYDISNSKDIIVNTMSSGYGISLNYKVSAGEKYYVQLSEWANCYVGTSYYNTSGVNIGYGVATKNSSFTMPDNCVWLYVCLIPRETALNTDIHFKDLMVVKTDKELSSMQYEPYGYKVPIRVNGKNKYSANTGIYSGVRIISLDTIKVKPNTDYVISVDKYTIKEPMFGIKYVDEPVYGLTPQQSWATGTQFKGNDNKFNSGNHEYILIRGWDTNEAYGIDENTKIQIEEGTVKTEFEPYVEPTTINLYLNEPLRKIGEFADYIDYKNKKINRFIGSVDLASASWTYQETQNRWVTSSFRNLYKLWDNLDVKLNGISNKYIVYSYNAMGGSAYSEVLGLTVYGSNGNMFVRNGSTTQTPTGTLYFELATPTEEIIDITEISTSKGTNIFSIETSIKPSETKVNYWKQI